MAVLDGGKAMFAKMMGTPPCRNEELREAGQHCVHTLNGTAICCQCGATPNPLLEAMEKAANAG